MERTDVEELLEEIQRLKGSLSEKEDEIEGLRVNKLFLETLFDGIDEEIMVIDREYSIRDVNRVFLQSYGVKKNEILGKKCYEIKYQGMQPCHFAKQACPLEKARQSGQRVEMVQCREWSDGETRELMQIMYPLVEIESDTEVFVEISRDATEYRNLIQKLQISEKRFKAVLDTATDTILSIDDHKRILLFNNAAEHTFGYSEQEILGKGFDILVPPQYGEHYSMLKAFLKGRTPDIEGQTLSLTGFRKDGEEFPIEAGFFRVEMEGGITYTATIRDVSSQKQLERKLLQSERLAAVGQAVAHVAHEIKNPLMIIGGFSHQLRRGLGGPNAFQKLDMIIDEVRRLEKLVANLGDFTKEYKLVKRPADMNAVILDVLKIMAEIYSPNKYSFIEEPSPDLKEINCDPDKLKQVFMNIIANGIEAMEGGGVITLSTANLLTGVEVRLRDEGRGMDEEELLHIFEPFYTTREKGSGLGLSISYKIVEAHNGEIWAESAPGRGTTFFVTLPFG